MNITLEKPDYCLLLQAQDLKSFFRCLPKIDLKMLFIMLNTFLPNTFISVYVFYLALSCGPQAFNITRRNECTAFFSNMDFSTNYKNGNTNLNSKILSFVNFKNSY